MPRTMDSRRWRLLWRALALLVLAALAAETQAQVADGDTFSLPVSYSMPAPAALTSGDPGPLKKSAILHHFKTIRGSTSTTARAEEDGSVEITPAPPRYSSSYSSQRVQLQVQPGSYPASRQDEQALMQKQQSYQDLHDYQALSRNSYQNLASLQDQGLQDQGQQYQSYQQAAQQQQQAYQQMQQQKLQQAYEQQKQAYEQQQQSYQQAAQQQPTQQQQQAYQQQLAYQQQQAAQHQKQAAQQQAASQKQAASHQQQQAAQQQQAYHQQQAAQQQQAYEQQQKQAYQQQASQQQQGTQQQQQTYPDQSQYLQQGYQQKTDQTKKHQDEQKLSNVEDDSLNELQQVKATTYTPNVLTYMQAQASGAATTWSTTSPAPQPVPNAVSIEEAVAAAAAVTQTPELPPLSADEAQRIFAQQQEIRLQQQQQYLLAQHQLQMQQQQQQQVTPAPYERYYQAVAATGVTPNPLLSPAHVFTPPTPHAAPGRGAVLPHYKQPAPASPVMQAAVNYYKNGYYADPALLQHLTRSPYRRVSGPAPRPHAHPRPRPHAHAHTPAHAHTHARPHHHHSHAAPYSRHKSSPNVQHFFHGPYTMESPLGSAGAGAGAGAAPDSWIEHAIAPVKRDDSLLSGLGAPPGSSTALLNGLIVPIVLLGISIPALGFAYSYLSRRRGFNDDVTSFVQNLRPNEETVEYYFGMLQNAIECYNDPKLQHCE